MMPSSRMVRRDIEKNILSKLPCLLTYIMKKYFDLFAPWIQNFSGTGFIAQKQ